MQEICQKNDKNAKIAKLSYSVINQKNGLSLLSINLQTGRMHQIRAQLAHLGFAIVGDGKYGKNADNKKFKTKTQKLTAISLKFAFKNEKLRYLNDLNLQVKPTWLNV